MHYSSQWEQQIQRPCGEEHGGRATEGGKGGSSGHKEGTRGTKRDWSGARSVWPDHARVGV